MSTLSTRDAALNHEVGAKPEEMMTRPSADRDNRSVLSRLFTWYRDAVLSPATEPEKEDWQKHSF